MTRFQELQQIAADNTHRWGHYQGACLFMVRTLYDGLKHYLGATDADFASIPTIGDYDQNGDYSLETACRIGDDSFLHFGIQLLIEPQPVLIPFRIKTTPEGRYDAFRVRVGEQDREFSVPSIKEEDHAAIFEYVFQLIKEDIEQSLERWLARDETTEPLKYAFYRPHPPQAPSYEATEVRREVESVPSGPAVYIEWMTTDEAVTRSGYDIEYVRRLIRQRKIVAVKKGRDWWINRASFDAYLEAMRSSEDKRAGPKSGR